MDRVKDENVMEEKLYNYLAEEVQYLDNLCCGLYQQMQLWEFEHTERTSYEWTQNFLKENIVVTDLMLEAGASHILAYLISWKLDRQQKAKVKKLDDSFLSVESVILNYETLWKAIGYYKGLQGLTKKIMKEMKEMDKKDDRVTFKLFTHIKPLDEDVKTAEEIYELRYNHDDKAENLEIQHVTERETFKATKDEYMLRKAYLMNNMKRMAETLRELHLLLERGKESYLAQLVVENSKEKKRLKSICEKQEKELIEAREKLTKLHDVQQRKIKEMRKTLHKKISDKDNQIEVIEAEKSWWYKELDERRKEIEKKNDKIKHLNEELDERRKEIEKKNDERRKEIEKKNDKIKDLDDDKSKLMQEKISLEKKIKDQSSPSNFNYVFKEALETIIEDEKSKEIAELKKEREELRKKISEKENGDEYLCMMKLRTENEELQTKLVLYKAKAMMKLRTEKEELQTKLELYKAKAK